MVLVLVGCPGDGVATGGSSETGGHGTSGAVSMSETGALPTSTPTTSGSTDPGGGTTDGSSGGTTTSVEGSSGDGSEGSSGSSTGAEAFCGPPCDAPWVHEGSLKINEDTDLASLRCLVEVTGTLELGDVVGSPPAELANLRKIGWDLQISFEHEMTSMAGLECVEFVGGKLSLRANKKLADISALARLKHIGSLRFRDSPLVTDLSPWDGVTGLKTIDMADMSGVPRLPVLGPGTVLQELIIEHCVALTDLDALAGVSGDPLGFTVGLTDLPSLTSIAGLGDLWQGSGSALWLVSLPALESLAGVEGITGDPQGIVLLRHLPLVSDVEALAGIEELSTLYLDGLPKVSTLAPLAGLRGVERLTLGSCSENNKGVGLDGVTTFAPLEGLEGLWQVSIARNDALTQLPQFKALESDISMVSVIDNPKLTAMQVDAFVGEHGGCAAPPMQCPCFEDFANP